MARKNAAYSDTKQSRIGYLIHDYVFMANAMQPKVCVMENVPGIAKSEVFHLALERLRRWGYLVACKKLVSSELRRSPETAENFFVIAVRPDVAAKAGIKSEEGVADVFPRPSSGAVTIRQALAGLAIDKGERDMLLTATRQSAVYELVKTLPFDPPKHTRMRDVAADWTSDFGLTRAASGPPLPHHHRDGSAGARAGRDLSPRGESRIHDSRDEAIIGSARRLQVERHVLPEGGAYRTDGPAIDD